MPHDLLSEIGIAVIAAIVAGVLMHRLRQPIVLGYLLAGALIGPEIGFSWVAHPMSITIISEIGLVLLLFIIGLEMDLKPLLAAGADRVLLPYALAGENLADFLTARTGVAETVIRRPV